MDQKVKTLDKRKLDLLKAQKAKEQAFKIVVKIISWESGSSAANIEKITLAEWKQYKKHRSGAFAAIDRDKAKTDLAKTYNSIKAHGGFA